MLCGVSWSDQVLDISRTPFAQYREQDVVSHMPGVARPNHGSSPSGGRLLSRVVKIGMSAATVVVSAEVLGVGTVALNFDWTERGAALALPFIQQMFKRWDGGRITHAAATQSTKTSVSKSEA